MRKDISQKKISTGQSLASSFTSPVIPVAYLDNVGIQINITTTNSTGNFSVQGSTDYRADSGNVINAGTWVTLTLSGSPTAGAANDNIIISLNQVPFSGLRVQYTPTIAGTGTCDIIELSKQVGG